MQVLETPLCGVRRIRPAKHADDRGWFAEAFNARRFEENGVKTDFVQDNQSLSMKGVLRGLHYQITEPQGKLVRVVAGHIWDVAVDLRPGSPSFGQWAGFHLHADDLESLWIPEGFAHGFLVLSDTASVLYKTTRFYHASGERCIRWDDPTLAIRWPLGEMTRPLISAKDAQGVFFGEAEVFPAVAAEAPSVSAVLSKALPENNPWRCT